MSETDLEAQLLDKLQEFLLELGEGFCFESRQKRILIGDTHNFIDLVFYHRILKCHVLVELKLESFSYENIGQLNTYVSWYDRNVRGEDDNPPVGILLCTERNQSLVEYALAGMDNSLFVSRYQLQLPSKETLQAQLETERQRLEGRGDGSPSRAYRLRVIPERSVLRMKNGASECDSEIPRSGPYWTRTSDLSDVNRTL